ncbi:hypothetical protein Q8A67_022091 [Cirrhinus molitorella]|uniref:Uncharacterized protein n=1 Tax=Cirrhinus molitorella TaxID=172907 RepID=A0AA88TEV9_9TELE|nr:hypothetical protein Q8A67_022091 [Cirrhinus molitorella]
MPERCRGPTQVRSGKSACRFAAVYKLEAPHRETSQQRFSQAGRLQKALLESQMKANADESSVMIVLVRHEFNFVAAEQSDLRMRDGEEQ